jgi:hypothetical protein
MFGDRIAEGWLLATPISRPHTTRLISMDITRRKNLFEYPTKLGITETILKRLLPALT